MICDAVRERWMPLAAGTSMPELAASDLGPDEARALAEHLASCAACASEMAQWRAARLSTLARARPVLAPGWWDGFHAGVLARIDQDVADRAFAPRKVELPADFWEGWSTELAQRIAAERARVDAGRVAPRPIAEPRAAWAGRRAWLALAAAVLAVAVVGWPWLAAPPVRDVAESPPVAPEAPSSPSVGKVEEPWSVRPVRGFALDNSVRVKRAASEPGWTSALDVVRPLDVARPFGAARRLAPPVAPDFPIERSPVPAAPGDRASF